MIPFEQYFCHVIAIGRLKINNSLNGAFSCYSIYHRHAVFFTFPSNYSLPSLVFLFTQFLFGLPISPLPVGVQQFLC
jgi:hypothetical protein